MKAILVIDKPESCEECPLRSYSDLALFCTPLRKIKEEWDECPLKPMPKRKNEYTDIDAIGWNNCLEEIEK